MPEQGLEEGSYQVWLSHPQGAPCLWVPVTVHITSLYSCSLRSTVGQAHEPPDCPTPSLFYWTGIIAVQGLGLGWVLGVLERKTTSIHVRSYQSIKSVSESRRDKSQNILEMTCDPSSGPEANRKVYKAHLRAGCVAGGK